MLPQKVSYMKFKNFYTNGAVSSEYLDRRSLRNGDLTANTHMILIGINENICMHKNTCTRCKKI